MPGPVLGPVWVLSKWVRFCSPSPWTPCSQHRTLSPPFSVHSPPLGPVMDIKFALLTFLSLFPALYLPSFALLASSHYCINALLAFIQTFSLTCHSPLLLL